MVLRSTHTSQNLAVSLASWDKGTAFERWSQNRTYTLVAEGNRKARACTSECKSTLLVAQSFQLVRKTTMDADALR